MSERDPYAINQVLTKFNLTLEPINARSSNCALSDELAFLLYEHKRWHAFRRVGVHWMNLSDGMDRPRSISSQFLADALLHKQRELYCELFTVRGQFLPSAVDTLTFWDTPFKWLTDVDDEGHAGTDCYTIQGDYCVSGKCLGQLRCACEENKPLHENEQLLKGGFEADMMATLDSGGDDGGRDVASGEDMQREQ